MSTLAAEGNPKEDKIVIAAGEVLSTAQLDIDFEFFASPFGIPAPPEGLTVISSSCSDVFEWAGENDNNIFQGSAGGRDWLYLRDSGTSGGSLDKYYDQTLHLRINSTPFCYGVLWQKIFPLNFTPGVSPAAGSEVFWRVSFNGVIDGTGRCGPCVWVDDASKHDNATLFAMVVNKETGQTELRRWTAASLASVDNSTLIGTMVLPNIGDRMTIYMDQFPNAVGLGSNGVFADISDINGSFRDSGQLLFEDTKVNDKSTARHAKMGFGFVSIGGVTAGKMEFKTNSASTILNTTPFVIISNTGGT